MFKDGGILSHPENKKNEVFQNILFANSILYQNKTAFICRNILKLPKFRIICHRDINKLEIFGTCKHQLLVYHLDRTAMVDSHKKCITLILTILFIHLFFLIIQSL